MNLEPPTPRQKEILFAIIEQYAETATPVGSILLSRIFGVSSATIRAEMSQLESLGLIAQPHTSAGRIPTDAGYRFYVNSISEQISAQPDQSLLPAHAGTPGGGAQPEVRSQRGSYALKARIGSQSRADYAIRGAVDTLVELTGNLGLATIGDQLYISGISKLFTQPEFLDVDRVQSVAELLDNLEPWLREAAPGQPLSIFIGRENPIGKTSGASLIISRFRSPFSDKSYIGVLGPTRQNYARVMPLVRIAGSLLEQAVPA